MGSHEELINRKGIYYKMYTGIFEEADDESNLADAENN